MSDQITSVIWNEGFGKFWISPSPRISSKSFTWLGLTREVRLRLTTFLHQGGHSVFIYGHFSQKSLHACHQYLSQFVSCNWVFSMRIRNQLECKTAKKNAVEQMKEKVSSYDAQINTLKLKLNNWLYIHSFIQVI